MKITKELSQKVLSIVDKGLSKGLGQPEEGKMCIEAAVCFALGLPHGDNPPCVGSAVRRFKIILNDKNWSSDKARANGMRKLSIAQLGSDSIDQTEFSKKLAFKTITILLSEYLTDKWPTQALKCKNALNLKEAKYAAADAAYAAADADAAAAAYAAADAAADAAAYAAADAAADAAAAAADAAAAAAYAAADADSAAAAYAAADADSAAAIADSAAAIAADASCAYLIMSANLALECLIELKSPGCEFLYLCD